MKWSKSLPDRIGWWFRRSKPKHLDCWAVDVVYIYQQDGQLMVEQCTCHKVPLKGVEPESREEWMQDEWAGPIEEPEEPAVSKHTDIEEQADAVWNRHLLISQGRY